MSLVGFRNFPVFQRFSPHSSYNIFVEVTIFFARPGRRGGAPRDLQKTAAQRRLMLTGISSHRRQNPSKIDPFSVHTYHIHAHDHVQLAYSYNLTALSSTCMHSVERLHIHSRRRPAGASLFPHCPHAGVRDVLDARGQRHARRQLRVALLVRLCLQVRLQVPDARLTLLLLRWRRLQSGLQRSIQT